MRLTFSIMLILVCRAASGTADITSPSTFGVISNTVSSTSFRRLQMSLRLDF